jgi:hippurate hydrolase
MLEQRARQLPAIGNGEGEPGACMVHNPGYDFNDEILTVGAAYWTRLGQSRRCGRTRLRP